MNSISNNFEEVTQQPTVAYSSLPQDHQQAQQKYALNQQYVPTTYFEYVSTSPKLQSTQSESHAASRLPNSFESRPVNMSPPKSNSPNSILYQQLLKLLSNNSNSSQMSDTEINLLLAKPKIREQLKQLHMQLLNNPDLYLPQLEQVILSRASTQNAMSNVQEPKKINTINFSSNFKRKTSSLSRRPDPVAEISSASNKPNPEISTELLNLKTYYLKNANNSVLLSNIDTEDTQKISYVTNYNSFMNSF
jgi:hypothetical protein